MKIIKKSELTSTKFKCQSCGCEYEAEYGEYTTYSTPLARIRKSVLKRCICPLCGEMNQIEYKLSGDEE